MTTDVELLPLPEGYDKCAPPLLYEGQMFHEGQMRAYARANVAPLQAEIEALRRALKEAEEAMRFVHASCATFPQEPQHVQNAAWRRIVNAITKARAVLEGGKA